MRLEWIYFFPPSLVKWAFSQLLSLHCCDGHLSGIQLLWKGKGRERKDHKEKKNEKIWSSQHVLAGKKATELERTPKKRNLCGWTGPSVEGVSWGCPASKLSLLAEAVQPAVALGRSGPSDLSRPEELPQASHIQDTASHSLSLVSLLSAIRPHRYSLSLSHSLVSLISAV